MQKITHILGIVALGAILVLGLTWADNTSAQTTTTTKTRSVAVTSNSKWPVTVQSVRGKNYVTAPFPTKVGEPLSYCDPTTGDQCSSGIKLPTFQYTSPFKKFVGRYFDGRTSPWSNVGWIKGLNLGANKIIYIPQKNKIYTSASTTIMAYNADTFFGAIQNEPLKYFYSQHPGSGVYALGGIPWDAHFFPIEGQSNVSSSLGVNAWVPNAADNSSIMSDFDVDDRGYIYMIAQDGFGVAKDGGSIIKPVLQVSGGEVWDSVGFTASTKEIFLTGSAGINKVIRSDINMNRGPILTFKSNGKYYISTGANPYRVFDMTNPLKPEFVAEGNSGKLETKFVRIPLSPEEIIAVETIDSIEIYKASDFATGGAPSKTFTGEDIPVPGSSQKCEGYNGLTADNISGKIYSLSCVKEGSGDSSKYLIKLSIFTPTNTSDPTTYTETKHNLGLELLHNQYYTGPTKFRPLFGIVFNNGYIFSAGVVNNTYGFKLWIIKDGKPVELKTNNFLENYYVTAPEGYAKANTAGYYNSQLMTYGGKDYLFYSGQQQGDVYELEPVSRDGATTTPGNILTTITNLVECGLGHLFNFKTGALCSGASVGGGSAAPQVLNVQGPTSLNAGEQGTWTITATDPGNDDLSWSVDWGSGRSTASCKRDPGAGAGKNWTYIISHSWLSAGAKTVTVYLDDCKGGKTTQTFTVTVGGGVGGGGDNQDQNAN